MSGRFSIKIVLLMVFMVSLSASLQATVANRTESENVCKNWLSTIVASKGSWAGSLDPTIGDILDIREGDRLLARCYLIEPDGFIVVPVLKELPPVNAYYEKGRLDVDEENGVARFLIDVLIDRYDRYEEKYGSLEADQASGDKVLFGVKHQQHWEMLSSNPTDYRAVKSYTPGDILLTTTWGQRVPYNDFCPEGDGGRCVVGCVATAVSQIVNYWEWPQGNGIGYKEYEWDGDQSCEGDTEGQILGVDYSQSTYDWANMLDDYSGSYTPVQGQAVAKLCYEIGVALEMDYGRCGSGAWPQLIMQSLPEHLYYDPFIYEKWRFNFNSQEWFNIIVSEIDAERPILYTIPEPSHAIVCDGWQIVADENQCHMNYGWNGMNNFWFSVDEIQAGDQDLEYMHINIKPDSDDDGDGILNNHDNCPFTYNDDQADDDNDDVGNACDNCPQDYNPYQRDNDNDDVGNDCDNCPNRANPGQEDIDNDGVGNACHSPIYVDLNYIGPSEGTVDKPFSDIKAAVDFAEQYNDNYARILVLPGTYSGTANTDITWSGGLDLIIESANGPEETIIDCNGSQAFIINDGQSNATKIIGLTIENGSGTYGGGIQVSNSSPQIINCTFTNCQATKGGAIFTNSSSTIIKSSKINNCQASQGGGIYCSQLGDGNIDITYTLFYSNTATIFGGALYLEGGLYNISNCTFAKNSAVQGNAVYSTGENSSYSLSYSVVANNTGDGIYCNVSVPQNSYDCNVFWSNPGGHLTGNCAFPGDVDAGTVEDDPEFCDLANDDYGFFVDSPCDELDNDCGKTIGALEAGCSNLDYWRVRIPAVDEALMGHIVPMSVEITPPGPANPPGGVTTLGEFDVRVYYDQQAMAFVGAQKGEFMIENDWGHFNYHWITSPVNHVRITGKSLGGQTTITKPEELFKINFLLSAMSYLADDWYEVRFVWPDGIPDECESNILVDESLADTVKTHMVCYSNGYPLPTDPPSIWVPDAACLDGEIQGIDFYDGWYYFVDEHLGEPGRGDVNHNGIPFDIGDLINFQCFLYYGISSGACYDDYLAEQLAATDINCDGIGMQITDLLYMIRIILDDLPPDCPYKLSLPNKMARSLNDTMVVLGGTGQPGEDNINIGLHLTNQNDLGGFRARIEYDTAVLTPRLDTQADYPDPVQYTLTERSSDFDEIGDIYVQNRDDGVILVTFLPDDQALARLDAGSGLVLDVLFDVKTSAPLGDYNITFNDTIYEYNEYANADATGGTPTLISGSFSVVAAHIPRIIASNPQPNELNVGDTASIVITFNTYLDPTTIDSTSVKVFGNYSGQISGVINYDSLNRQIIFDPIYSFKPGEQITFILTDGIKSTYGFNLDGYAAEFLTQVDNTCGIWGTSGTMGAGNKPNSVYAADLNGDGKNDLITPNHDGHNISVFIGNGDGTFENHVLYPSGTTPWDVTAADLDGDGDLDLASSNYGSGNVAVLFNNGDGTFATPPLFYGVAAGPHPILAADLDNDTDIDLITGNLLSDNITVLKNNGDGTFAGPANYAVSDGPVGLAAADNNNDGYIDLFVANYYSDTLSLLRNKGNGTFDPADHIPMGADGPFNIIAEDLDGDGDIDLATANRISDNISVLLQDEAGTFDSIYIYPAGTDPYHVYPGDMDGDGDLDLVSANLNSGDIALFTNDSGLFAVDTTLAMGTGPIWAITADFNLDGRLDLAVANAFSDNVSVVLKESIDYGPTLVSPINGYSTYSHYITLYWEDLVCAETYEVWVSYSSDFVFNARMISGLTQTHWLISPNLGHGTWYWKVRGHNSSGPMEWSAVRSFTITYEPSCPVLFVYNDEEFLFENPLLTACEKSGYIDIVTDYYHISQPPDAQSRTITLQLRELEDETSFIHDIELITVDHPSDVKIACDVSGEISSYKEMLRPVAAIDHTGNDKLADLIEQDGEFFKSDEPGWLEITFETDQSNQGAVGVAVSSLPKYKCPEIPVAGSKGPAGQTAIQNEIQDLPQLTVKYQNINGAWVDLPDIPSRTNISDAFLMNNDIVGQNNQFKIKISWQNSYSVDAVWSFVPEKDDLTMQTFKISSGEISGNGRAGKMWNKFGNETLVLEKGDIFEFSFDLNEMPAGKSARDFIIRAVGRYQPNYLIKEKVLPVSFTLYDNYPDPFNATTIIEYDLPSGGNVKLEVFNILGQRVAALRDEYQEAGHYSIAWQGTDDSGHPVASGIYFYRIMAGEFVKSKKMMLLK